MAQCFHQVDEDALVALVALLRVGSPLAKSHLQRLFLNLCQHNETMRRAVGIIMCLLRAPLSSDEASAAAAAELSQGAAPASAPPEEPPTSLEAALQVGLFWLLNLEMFGTFDWEPNLAQGEQVLTCQHLGTSDLYGTLHCMGLVLSAAWSLKTSPSAKKPSAACMPVLCHPMPCWAFLLPC
jgi:hypothetical protein